MEVARRLASGEEMRIAGPALVETYAVLTRLPAPNRLNPADCWGLIEANFLGKTPPVVLDPAAYVSLVRDAALSRTAGGQIYDAVIAACAKLAGVDTLLTFNERHFAPLAGPDMHVVVPSAG